MYIQWFFQENIGSENGSFIKNRRPFKRTLHKKTPKIQNYNAIFDISSAGNEFTRKRLKNFTKLHFFTINK